MMLLIHIWRKQTKQSFYVAIVVVIIVVDDDDDDDYVDDYDDESPAELNIWYMKNMLVKYGELMNPFLLITYLHNNNEPSAWTNCARGRSRIV